MNIDNDYDNDGNNIVPCPICLDVYCPSKENGKCPEEDMFALEGEIRMLLDEYKATDDNSRIANVLEAVEKILLHQLQKAREEERKQVQEEEKWALEFRLQKYWKHLCAVVRIDLYDEESKQKALHEMIVLDKLEAALFHSELDQDKK